MLTYEKQALSGTIEVLLRSELPDEFEGTKLYGSLEEDELRQDCKIFRLSNETGHGRITVYQVFSGIELYYNDMHMGYCNQNQATAKNMIEINHSYLRTYRLQVAKKLLLETESSVTEIASKIGYENPNKFTSAFKETYGSSPTEFRKSVRLDRSGSVWSGEEI